MPPTKKISSDAKPMISDFEMTPCLGRTDEEIDVWIEEETAKILEWQKTETAKVLEWQKTETAKMLEWKKEEIEKTVTPLKEKAKALREKAKALKEKANVAFAKAVHLNDKAKTLHEKLKPNKWFTKWVYRNIMGHDWKPFVHSPEFVELQKEMAELNKEGDFPVK